MITGWSAKTFFGGKYCYLERPSWSDDYGKIELTKESFTNLDPKYEWLGEWFLTLFQADRNLIVN